MTELAVTISQLMEEQMFDSELTWEKKYPKVHRDGQKDVWQSWTENCLERESWWWNAVVQITVKDKKVAFKQ